MDFVKSRRQEYADATRAALLAAGLRLFTTQGYASTSLEQIAAAARVTKGAIYHHFAGKATLLEELANQLDQQVADRVIATVAAEPDLWRAAVAGLDVYLDACVDPSYGLLVHRELPPLVGQTAWSDAGQGAFGELIFRLVTALSEGGLIAPYPPPLVTRLLFAMLAEASIAIAQATDPDREREAARAILMDSFNGLRSHT